MQNKFTKYYLILILVLGCFSAKSQMPFSLYYLENVPQSNFINPAMAPRCNVFVGLPSVYYNFHQNMPVNTLLQKTESGTVSFLSPDYDLGKLEKKIGNGFTTYNNIIVSPLSFGFRLKTGYVTFAISTKMDARTNLPYDLFTMPNKHFFPKNTTYDFSGLGVGSQIYNEYAFGYSRNITKKLRVGARVKILQGLVAIKSDISKLQVTTSKEFPDDLPWNLNVNGAIYTSAPLEIIPKTDGTIDTIKMSDDFEDSGAAQYASSYLSDFSNFGLATDLGATYKLNYAWEFSASINDLGFISWKKDLNSIHFSGNYTFEGLNIDGENMDSTDVVIEQLMDTIKNVVNYHAEQKSFRTRPTTMFHLGSKYNVNHYFSAGFLSRTSFNENYFHQEFSLSANLNTFRGGLTTNLNYNVALNGEQYAGVGLAFKLLPLQFYMMLDHIPLVYTNYIIKEDAEDTNPEKIPGPYDLRSFNFMFGFNLILGAHGYRDSPKIDAYSEF